MFRRLFALVALLVVACEDGSVPIEQSVEPITQAIAQELAVEEAGVDLDLLIYADMLPYVVAVNEAKPTWGFIEALDHNYVVTYIDQQTGDVISAREAATPNILDFIEQQLDSQDFARGSSPGTYDSFPWNWRLPMDGGSFTLTCGYGCGEHNGSIYYSTDWANGTYGKLLEAPASGWVMYTTVNSGYGYQIIAESGNANNGKRYYYRLGHLNSPSMVVPGWWVEKGRGVGYIGSTGYSSGPHVHFEAVRAYSTSGGYFSGGETLPINKWPGGGDSICSGAFASKNFYGSYPYSGTFNTNGCP